MKLPNGRKVDLFASWHARGRPSVHAFRLWRVLLECSVGESALSVHLSLLPPDLAVLLERD